MSRQRDREEFVATILTEGVPLDVARTILRHAASLHRLAERECNGDDWQLGYPWGLIGCPKTPAGTFNGGVYIGPSTGDETCPTCGFKGDHGYVSRSSIKIGRLRARVKALLTSYAIEPVFSGDPRGAVVKLKLPSGRTNDWGREGLCVP